MTNVFIFTKKSPSTVNSYKEVDIFVLAELSSSKELFILNAILGIINKNTK